MVIIVSNSFVDVVVFIVVVNVVVSAAVVVNVIIVVLLFCFVFVFLLFLLQVGPRECRWTEPRLCSGLRAQVKLHHCVVFAAALAAALVVVCSEVEGVLVDVGAPSKENTFCILYAPSNLYIGALVRQTQIC